MLKEDGDKQVETACRSTSRGPQFFHFDRSTVFYAGPQINQYYPPHFYPLYPQVGGYNDPVQQLAGGGVAQQLYARVPSHPYPGYAQRQYVIDPGHQWYLQVQLLNTA